MARKRGSPYKIVEVRLKGACISYFVENRDPNKLCEMIKLQQMDEASYDKFMSNLLVRYARDRMQGNLLSESEAIEFTQSQWRSILPSGRSSLGHFFFNLLNPDSETQVGAAWLFIDQQSHSSFIYELFLEPEFRGKGLGRASLQALEDYAKSNQSRTLGLNVFAWNQPAKSLYSSFGFTEVSTDMIKQL